MTASQAIIADATFNRFACSVEALCEWASRDGMAHVATASLASARDLLANGEAATAQLYLNRARWALDAKDAAWCA